MNWHEIKKQYPLTFKNLQSYIGEELVIDDDGNLFSYEPEGKKDQSLYNNRDLYDFFSFMGIEITIEFVPQKRESTWNGNLYHVWIEFKQTLYNRSSRLKAETDIFTIAFAYLEKGIKKAAEANTSK